MTARNVLDENKRLVTEFYELAINQQRPAEAARKYIELPALLHLFEELGNLSLTEADIEKLDDRLDDLKEKIQ